MAKITYVGPQRRETQFQFGNKVRPVYIQSDGYFDAATNNYLGKNSIEANKALGSMFTSASPNGPVTPVIAPPKPAVTTPTEPEYYAPPPTPPPTPVSAEQQLAAEEQAKQEVDNSVAGQSFAPLLDTLQGIGRPTIAPFAPIAPTFEGMAPVAITRPGNDYYQNLFGAKFSPLNQEYFGENQISDQAIGEANRRGLLTQGPSGVAGQLYENTVMNPFARAVTDIQNQVNIIKTETEMDLAKYDAGRRDEFNKFRADLIEKDREYGVNSVKAQADIDNTYLSLESEIRQAIANGATEEKLAELNARVSTFTALVNERTQMARLDQEAAIEAKRLAQERMIEDKRLEEDRLGRQGNWYNDAAQIPGAQGPQVPYEELDIPRPEELDDNGNRLYDNQGRPYPVDENGNVIEGTYSNQGVATSPGGQQIRMENPGANGSPNRNGEDYGEAVNSGRQSIIGSDGKSWWWNRARGLWSNVKPGAA